LGLPHEKLQEVAAAVLKRRPGARLTDEEVIRRCREVMEWPKVPRYVLFLNNFEPFMTVTGKVQKFKLKNKEWAGRERRVN